MWFCTLRLKIFVTSVTKTSCLKFELWLNTIQFVKQEHRINDPNKYFFFYNNEVGICVRDLTKGLVSCKPQSRATCVTPGPKGVGATIVTARSQGF